MDDRVCVIHKIRGGVCDARNSGLGAATGNYIMFVDNDDFIMPNICEILMENMMQCQVSLSICSYQLYWEKAENNIILKDNITRPMNSIEALLPGLI